MARGSATRLHTADWVKQATQQLAAKGAELVAVKRNPIDAVWADRPSRPRQAGCPVR
jgi:hypothetical protein